jgi:hypothetical protein
MNRTSRSVRCKVPAALAAGEAAGEGAAREALIQEVLRRQEHPTAMPAWEGEPEVQAHILDLYTYLEGRSTGKVPAGVPAY